MNYFAHFLGKLGPKESTKYFSVPNRIAFWAMRPALGSKNEVGTRYLAFCGLGRGGVGWECFPEFWFVWLLHSGAICTQCPLRSRPISNNTQCQVSR